MALVELRHVSKIYHLGGEEIRALDEVSLDIEAGEFLSIIGPSGSGKSTLMHILGCLDTPTHGTLHLDGVAIHTASKRELAAIRNPRRSPPAGSRSGTERSPSTPTRSWRGWIGVRPAPRLPPPALRLWPNESVQRHRSWVQRDLGAQVPVPLDHARHHPRRLEP